MQADHTDVPLRDLTEETIEYVHERYDPAAPASFKTRAVRVKHRKPVPEEWSGERASESEADLKVRLQPFLSLVATDSYNVLGEFRQIGRPKRRAR